VSLIISREIKNKKQLKHTKHARIDLRKFKLCIVSKSKKFTMKVEVKFKSKNKQKNYQKVTVRIKTLVVKNLY